MKNKEIQRLKKAATKEFKDEIEYSKEISERIIEKYYCEIEYSIEKNIKKAIKEHKKYCIIDFFIIDRYINIYEACNEDSINYKKYDSLEIEFFLIERISENISKKYLTSKCYFNSYVIAVIINNLIFTKIAAKISLWKEFVYHSSICESI